MKIVTGHQPGYLPWIGLFHKISLADTFVFMDDVQYVHQDWHNRNRIKGPKGPFWLTVPVNGKASSSRLLKDILIDQGKWGSPRQWQMLHWRSLETCYRGAKHWDRYAPFFDRLYNSKPWKWLVELCEEVTHFMLQELDIQIEFIRASEYGFSGSKSDLVLDHCLKLEADLCVFGQLGRDYVQEDDFTRNSISVYYQNYLHPTYQQRFGEFVSNMSTVDLLFNCGSLAREIVTADNIRKEHLLEASKNLAEPGVVTMETINEEFGS